MTRRFAVSVDVDALPLYHAIHGLLPPPRDAVWELGVPRFLELFDRHGLRGTFFVVGQDLQRPGPREMAAEIVRRGHELASHSWSHPYDLIHHSDSDLLAEITRGEDALEALRGAPVRGFRAPGYNITPRVLELLSQRGYLYDSSAFPCPAYFAARAAIIGYMRLRGRRSQSIVGPLAAPFGAREPFRYPSGLLEVPMTVVPGVRLPVIGTSLALATNATVWALCLALARLSLVNLEFHGIDLLEAGDGVAPELLAVQPDLRVGLAKKRARYEMVFKACASADNAPLEELAPLL